MDISSERPSSGTLATERLVLAHSGLSHVGRVRSRNEDCIAQVSDLNLFIVADGMGGHQGGSEASRRACMAIEAAIRKRAPILQAFEVDPHPIRRREVFRLLQEAIRVASEQIALEAQLKPDLRGMATTVVVLLFAGDRAFAAHVGDSRLYLLREGRAELLTEDHSLFFELVRQGRLSKSSSFPYKNVVTRALGILGSETADVIDFEVMAGDRLIMCTDGLHGYLEDKEVYALGSQGKPEEAVTRLVTFANERGGSDNISAIVVDVLAVPGDEAGRTEREKALSRFPIFRGLTLGERIRLQALCDLRVLDDGEVLFREGDPTDGLYCVLKGVVELRRGGQVVATFGPGTEFGEMSLLERQGRLVTGIARGKTEVLTMTREVFTSLIKRSPGLASTLLSNLVRVLTSYLRDARDELQILRDLYLSEGREVPRILPSDALEEE